MICTRERVFSGIASQITELLQEKYGDGHECSRDLGEVPEQTQSEDTPRCWLWEGSSRLVGDFYETRIVRCRLLGVVKINAVNIVTGDGAKPLVQTMLNELEAMLDAIYFLDYANEVKINIRYDGEHELSAGDQVGMIEIPFEVEYVRDA